MAKVRSGVRKTAGVQPGAQEGGKPSGGLEGRVALVTGASRGIGRAIALTLARSGAELALVSTKEGGCAETLREIHALGREGRAWACDVGDPRKVTALIKAVEKAFGRVDIVVNNAGTVKWVPFVKMEDRDFDRTLAVNLSGPFYLTRRVLPGMLARRWGRIINISSISGTLGTPELSAYCASKWGVNGLTQALATELKGTGVITCAVLPGSVDTEMIKGHYEPVMTPEDIAGVVRYLCVEAPEAMNGSLVEVFG